LRGNPRARGSSETSIRAENRKDYGRSAGAMLRLERTAIIIVDMQNDFCSEGGWVDYIGETIDETRLEHVSKI
jgi:hypothetical protein